MKIIIVDAVGHEIHADKHWDRIIPSFVEASLLCTRTYVFTFTNEDGIPVYREIILLNFSSYQLQCKKTAIYPSSTVIEYPILGLVGEAGELANKYKKCIRGDTPLHKITPSLIDELGDVLWYVSALATDLGIDLATVAQNNLNKLDARKAKGTIQGSGDNR